MSVLKWNIGCSGYYYADWKEIFYPKGLPTSQWLQFYCQHFNTLEINNTFYRFPEVKNLENWYNSTPAQFIFSVKVPQIITHQKKFEGTKELLQNFYDVALNGLQEKCGPVLFQLPPRMQYSADKLKTIIEQLDPSFLNVIEFRHISWWRKEVLEELNNHHITFCGVSYPGLIDDVVINTPACYYRFHGVPQLYHSPYNDAFLQKVTGHINENEKVRTAYLYFNNTASAHAISNAKTVQNLVAPTA